jgi:hypothetical protein
VEPLDVVEDISPGLGSGPVLFSINPFSLEHSEEAFGCSIVGAGSNRTHAADQIVAVQEALIFLAGELAATI